MLGIGHSVTAAGGRVTDFREKPRRGIFELGFENTRGVYQAEKVEVGGGEFHRLLC